MVLPTKFLKQTRQLELTMTQMSQDCLKGLWFCKHAILDGNKTLVQDVSQMHEEVSEQGREAEQICMKILLLQHPVLEVAGEPVAAERPADARQCAARPGHVGRGAFAARCAAAWPR